MTYWHYKELTKTSLEGIIKAAKDEFKAKPELARKAGSPISIHRYSGRSLREIGNVFDIGESAVSKAGSRFESDMKESRMLRRRIERIRKAPCLSSV